MNHLFNMTFQGGDVVKHPQHQEPRSAQGPQQGGRQLGRQRHGGGDDDVVKLGH